MYQIQMCLLFESTSSLPGSLKQKIIVQQKYILKNVHKIIIYNCKAMETTRMPTNSELLEQNMADPHTQTL
jgi:hypothetical protein